MEKDTGYEYLEKLFNVRIEAIEKAIGLAREQMDKRLETMNEFRDQLNRQAGTFATKDEVETKIEIFRVGKKDSMALIISGLALLVAVISIIVIVVKHT